MSKITLEDKKILIVDDEPDVLESLEELLNMCTTVRAQSFEEADALLKSQDFDLAILDINGSDAPCRYPSGNGNKKRCRDSDAHRTRAKSG